MNRSRRRGQAMVEFAIVFPFLVLVLFALFDVAQLMFVQISLDSACAVTLRQVAMNDPATTRGQLYKRALAAAPGIELPPQAFRIHQVPGPDGSPWVEVDLRVEQTVISAFYASSSYRVTLESSALAPLQGAARDGPVHLP